MKKWLLTIISLVLAVTLTACGGNESDENTTW